MPALLTLRRQTTPGVFRHIGATTEQLGTTGSLGAAEDSAVAENSSKRVVVVRDYLLCANRGNVYKLASPFSAATAWTLSTALTGYQTLSDAAQTGLHRMLIDNKPVVVCAYRDTTGGTNIRIATYDVTAETWSFSGALAHTAGIIGSIGHSFVHRNKIYAVVDNGTFGDLRVLVIDPVALSVSTISGPTFEKNVSAAFAEWNGDLYLGPVYITAGGFTSLLRVTGGSFVVETTGAITSDNTFHNITGRGSMWTTTHGLWATWMDSVSPKKRLSLFTGTPGAISETDKTSLLPVGWSADQTNHKESVYQVQNAGAEPTTHIFYATDGTSGGSIQRFTFVDDVTALTDDGAQAGAGDWAFVSSTQGGGEYEFTPSQQTIEILDIQRTLGGMEISYALYGGGTANVAFYHEGGATSPDSVPKTLASIDTASGGLTITANVIQTVPADGATRTVRWLPTTDGYSIGDNVELVPYFS